MDALKQLREAHGDFIQQRLSYRRSAVQVWTEQRNYQDRASQAAALPSQGNANIQIIDHLDADFGKFQFVMGVSGLGIDPLG